PRARRHVAGPRGRLARDRRHAGRERALRRDAGRVAVGSVGAWPLRPPPPPPAGPGRTAAPTRTAPGDLARRSVGATAPPAPGPYGRAPELSRVVPFPVRPFSGASR